MEHLRFCGSLNIACGYAGEQGFCTLTRCPVVLDEFQAMRRHQGPTGPKGRPDGYWELPKRTQEKILNLCIAAGKENYQALFEFVTTDAGAQAVCLRHHLSPSTLERAVRRYYEAFPRKI